MISGLIIICLDVAGLFNSAMNARSFSINRFDKSYSSLLKTYFRTYKSG